jgi:hypothetical protein
VHRLPWHYCASTNRATSEYPTSKNKNHVIVPLLFVLLCINDPEQQEESYFSGKKNYKKKNPFHQLVREEKPSPNNSRKQRRVSMHDTGRTAREQ